MTFAEILLMCLVGIYSDQLFVASHLPDLCQWLIVLQLWHSGLLAHHSCFVFISTKPQASTPSHYWVICFAELPYRDYKLTTNVLLIWFGDASLLLLVIVFYKGLWYLHGENISQILFQKFTDVKIVVKNNIYMLQLSNLFWYTIIIQTWWCFQNDVKRIYLFLRF